MSASLPMYDLPEVEGATLAWWQGLARAFRCAGQADVPETLTRDREIEQLWADPALLFGQTCGYPLTHALRGRVRLIATPCYRADGCEGSFYRSLIMVREGEPARTIAELKGRPVAINGEGSFSGWHALRALIAREVGGGRFFGEIVTTGSHRASLAAVRAGRADLAAIDCVSHALIERHAPSELVGTRVLGRTPLAPGLPWITSAASSDATLARLRGGVFAALAAPDLAAARADLLIAGAEILPRAAYERIVALAEDGAVVS
jgi:ABC-type phosphate/phosphonate transport system substrate-binding protein